MDIKSKMTELREEELAFAEPKSEYRGWRIYVKSGMAIVAMKLTWIEAVAWCKSYNETMEPYRPTYFARMEREESPRKRLYRYCQHCGSVMCNK